MFVEASRRYYPFDLVPGVWDAPVLMEEEIQGGNGAPDELSIWAERHKNLLFHSTDVPDVLENYGRIITWAQRQVQYMAAAKAEFATVADGWVVAFALANGSTVVTQEVPAPESKRKIKIPDVCNAFNVPYANAFQMLRSLGVMFRYSP